MSGLSIQTQAFRRNMCPDKVLTVDLSRFGMHITPGMAEDGYSPDPWVWQCPGYENFTQESDPVVDQFLDDLDVVFSAETFYSYYLISEARRRGIRTVLQPNYEFLEWLVQPTLPEPDCFALPTTWHEDDIRAALPGREIVNLPVPVEMDLLPHRQRTELRTILHTAGTVPGDDRNGTQALIDAMRLVKSPVELHIRSQRPLASFGVESLPKNTQVVVKPVDNYVDLYDGDEDLFVFPRRFGGLCLPMQEAMGCGMAVLSTDIPPYGGTVTGVLGLIDAPVSHQLRTRAILDVHSPDVVHMAGLIDGMFSKVMAEASANSLRWAAAHSWDVLKSRYMEVLAG